MAGNSLGTAIANILGIPVFLDQGKWKNIEQDSSSGTEKNINEVQETTNGLKNQ